MGRVSSICHHRKGAEVKMTCTPSYPPPDIPIKVGAKLWARFDRTGAMEVVVCDDSTIRKRASVTARDLRTAFSNSSTILGREKAIVVKLEAIKAIITAEEVLLLEPLHPEVSALIERLKQQIPQESELPFEFQVLKIALEVFFSFVDSNVAALETQAWFLREELTEELDTSLNLKNLRSLKSNLTSLLARVQKARDEIKHLLDVKEDMADLYLTRKWIQQHESILGGTLSNTSNRNSSMVMEEDDVEDLEMLLHAYFIQLERMWKKILMMKEHIGNREGVMERKGMVDIAKFITVVILLLLIIVFGMNILDQPGYFAEQDSHDEGAHRQQGRSDGAKTDGGHSQINNNCDIVTTDHSVWNVHTRSTWGHY